MRRTPLSPFAPPFQLGGAHIVLYDPGAFVPYYIARLRAALSAIGVTSELVTSPRQFDDGAPAHKGYAAEVFFPWLHGRVGSRLRRYRVLRRAIKVCTYPAGVWRTWTLLGRRSSGVLHVQWAPVPVFDLPLFWLLRIRGWRIVFTAHEPLAPRTRPLQRALETIVIRSAHHVIVHTHAQRSEVQLARTGIPRSVAVVPHGALPERPSSVEEKHSYRSRLKLPSDPPLILFLGMIKRYKGLEYLIDAVAAVAKRIPDVELVIAGEPFIPVSEIERWITRSGMAHRVHSRPLYVTEEDFNHYLRAADVLVAPYTRIGASGIVSRAQANGVPVIATNVGGLPEVVEHESSGLIITPRNSAEIADAIVTLLSDRDRLALMSRRAVDNAARRFDWNNVSEQTVALYRGVNAHASEELRSPLAAPL